MSLSNLFGMKSDKSKRFLANLNRGDGSAVNLSNEAENVDIVDPDLQEIFAILSPTQRVKLVDKSSQNRWSAPAGIRTTSASNSAGAQVSDSQSVPMLDNNEISKAYAAASAQNFNLPSETVNSHTFRNASESNPVHNISDCTETPCTKH